MRVKTLVESLVAISQLKNQQLSENQQKCQLDELFSHCCFYTAQLAVKWIGGVKRACNRVAIMYSLKRAKVRVWRKGEVTQDWSICELKTRFCAVTVS